MGEVPSECEAERVNIDYDHITLSEPKKCIHL